MIVGVVLLVLDCRVVLEGVLYGWQGGLGRCVVWLLSDSVLYAESVLSVSLLDVVPFVLLIESCTILLDCFVDFMSLSRSIVGMAKLCLLAKTNLAILI